MKVKVNTQGTSQVVSVGIQGPSGESQFHLNNAQDIDVTAITDGSLLVYKANTSKWTATKTLQQQDFEGGQY